MQILLSLLTPDFAESWPFFMSYSWPFSFPILIRFSAHGHSHLYCCLIITILHFGGGCVQSSGRNRAAKCWPRHAHIWQDGPNNETIWVFIHLSEFNKVWRAIGYRMKIYSLLVEYVSDTSPRINPPKIMQLDRAVHCYSHNRSHRNPGVDRQAFKQW